VALELRKLDREYQKTLNADFDLEKQNIKGTPLLDQLVKEVEEERSKSVFTTIDLPPEVIPTKP
jgi:hypothetical protein